MKKFLLPLFIAFFFNAFGQDQRLYVRQNAFGANDGSSWTDAFADLQDALAVAQPGDSIWVAEGIYFPTSTADRTISFKVKSGIRLFGGFAGTENEISERDWEAHPVTLSGAIGSIFTTDNSLHILFLENPDSNTVVDGLRFTKGVENADTINEGGAAIYIWAKDSIGTPVSATRIRNCRFDDNSSVWYGGAVMVSSYGTDYTRFERCTFFQNDARFGGAVGIDAGETQAEFIDCQFISNEAIDGGGAIRISAWASGTRFSGCYFEKNRTKESGGGAVYQTGGSLLGKGVTFSSCRFLENVCQVSSYSEGGVIYMDSWSGADTLTVEHCIFTKNSGFAVSGIYVKIDGTAGTNFQIRHCDFEENERTVISVGGDSGGDFISSFVIRNCKILKTAGEAVSLRGTALAFAEAQITMDSCQVIDNGSINFNMSGSARLDIANTHFGKNKGVDFLRAFVAQVFIKNCIFEENKPSYWLFSWEEGTMALQNCLLRKNQTQDFMFAVNFGTLNIANCHFDANITEDYPFPFFEAEATISNTVFTNNSGVPYVIPGYTNPHFQNCYFSATVNNPPATVTFGPGNLTGLDPMFQNAAEADFRLQPCSPLVSAGDAAAASGLLTDLAGNPRVQGGKVDIGIFERPAPSLAQAPDIAAPCPGQPTGSVAFSLENGCAPYTTEWSSGGVSGQNLDGLAAGDYIFNITDTRGSVLTLPVSITEKPAPVLVPAVTPVTCGDPSGGSVSVTADGVAPFTFLWQNGSNDTTRTGLPAGFYPVTVTDADGCFGFDTVEVTAEGRLKASLKIKKITCPGYADGSLTITPQSGLAPFDLLWETGDTTASLANLGPGLYHATLTDALGCELSWAIPLSDPKLDCLGEAGSVFPNPFSDYLNVRAELEPGESGRWILADALGRIVTSVLLTEVSTTLHFPDLPAGIYFWQMWREGQFIRSGFIEKQ